MDKGITSDQLGSAFAGNRQGFCANNHPHGIDLNDMLQRDEKGPMDAHKVFSGQAFFKIIQRHPDDVFPLGSFDDANLPGGFYILNLGSGYRQ
jgi:hypothetical protein